MELQTLNVRTRSASGKGAAHQTRCGESVPTVLYGGGQDSVSLAVNKKELLKVLHGRGGEHAVLQLAVVDKPELSGPAMIKEVQHHPLKGQVLHADFQRIRLDERITTLVQVVLVGQSPGVVAGGVLDQQLRELEVECLALEVPEKIEVDVSQLNLGDSIHVSAVQTARGVAIITDPDRTVAAVHVPRSLTSGEETAAKEGEGEGEAKVEGKAEAKTESKK